MKKIKFLALALITSLSFTSCNDDDNAPVNEEEVITTVTITFTGGGQIVTLKSRDLDGDGPNAPVLTQEGVFAANTTYSGTISLLNELVTPADNISTEVVEEDTEHQFFYQTTGNDVFNYTSFDVNGKPLGDTFTFTTGTAGTRSLRFVLRHELNKNGENVANNDQTNAGGSIDLDVTFGVTIP